MTFTLLIAFIALVAAATSKKAAKKTHKDRNDNRGLTPFLLIDRTDNMCLGPKGFTNCDEGALWILTTRVGKSTYSLVSFQHPKEQTCLTRDSFLGVFASNNLKLGNCGSNHAKSWQWEFVEDYVRLSNGGKHACRRTYRCW
ncbi:hypothetical protein EON65_54715 [archaeon]|nr:MAG: hypothetical protein EON65_54715 [archaeon]